MARVPRKGFLRLSLVTCPIALFPATSESENISFNQINRNTEHRIKYMKVDADTGEEVSNDDIIKDYKFDSDRTSRSKEEFIARWNPRERSTSTSSFRKEIDHLYLVRPYYLVPDGNVVIRETVRSLDKVALGRVLSSMLGTCVLYSGHYLARTLARNAATKQVTATPSARANAVRCCWAFRILERCRSPISARDHGLQI